MIYLELLIKIFWFFIFIKTFLFWLWLWQLKEYYIIRVKAHFETQTIKKILSSFYWLKYPKFTSKILLIFFTGIGLAILWFFYLPEYLLVILSPLFSSLLVLAFQPLTIILQNRIFKKAKTKREKFKNLPSHLSIGGEGLLVIGITGSYGKTSTKDFLAEILSSKFYPVKSAEGGAEQFNRVNVLKTKENHNTPMGISNCVLKELKPEHQVFICEMGAYNKGEIKLICDIVKPKIGIITGVNEQHLALFGSMENLLSAEGGEELIASLPEDGMVFFNAKNSYCLKLYEKTKIKKFLYGEEVKMAGLENIEGAKLVAKELGMSNEEIERVVEKIENKFPGIKIEKSRSNLDIIYATYSVNPTAVIAHLDYLKTLRQDQGKLIVVMPCLIELGSVSKRIHKEIGEKINEICDLAIIMTKDYFKEIKQGAPNALFIEDPKEILEKIKNFTKEGDVILLEGRLSKELIDLIKKL